MRLPDPKGPAPAAFLPRRVANRTRAALGCRQRRLSSSTVGLVMKLLQWIVMGLIVLGAGTIASAQNADTAADGVRAADAAWLKGYSAKDLSKSVAFFDDQGSMLSPNDPIATGKAAISKLIAGGQGRRLQVGRSRLHQWQV